MAFNPQLPSGQAPSGLSYSRGAGGGDRSAVAKGQATGAVLSGIGGAVQTALAGADEVVKAKIYDDVQSDVNQVRSIFGVDAATEVVQDGINPSETERAKEDLARLNNAYQNGSLKPSHYYGKLNVITKSLKAKYPGYEREIDAMVQSTTGVNPANAIVSALRQEAEAEANAKDASANRWFSYVTQNGDWITRAYPNYFDLPDDQKPSQEQVISAVSKLQAEDSVITSRTKQLELELKQGTLDEKNLVSGARELAGTRIQQTIQAGLSSMGNTFSEIQQTIAGYQTSGEFASPEALQELKMGTASLLLTTSTNLRTELSTGVYAQLDETTRKEIIEGALAPIQALADAINNEDYGLVVAQAAWVEATKNANVADALKTGSINGKNIIENLQVVREVMGPDIFSRWIANGANLSAIDEALTTKAKANSALGTEQDLSADVSSAADVSSTAPKNIIQQTVNSLNITGLPVGPAVNIVNYMYRNPSATINQFKESQRANVYGTMFGPRTTEGLIKLREDDPEAWATYKKGAMDAFTETSRPIISEIREYPQAYTELIEVTFDKNTGQLVVRPSGAYMQVQASGLFGTESGPDPVATNAAVNEMIRNYQELNTMLLSLKPIVEADDKEGFAKSVDILLQSMGVRYTNPLSPDERGENPDLTQMEIPEGDSGALEFLSFVQSLEAPAGFNQIYSDDGTKQELDLSNMTIDEVIASQGSRVASGSQSSATGGLQIMRDTLKDLKKNLGLTGQEYFDEETQLALGLALLERRGLSKFRAGEISPETFANNLAMEWAALPMPSGKSYYSKVGKNRALTDRETLMSKIPLLAGTGGIDVAPEEGIAFPEKPEVIGEKLEGSSETETLKPA